MCTESNVLSCKLILETTAMIPTLVGFMGITMYIKVWIKSQYKLFLLSKIILSLFDNYQVISIILFGEV